MTDRDPKVEDVQKKAREDHDDKAVRRPEQGPDWAGEPAEDAERRRGGGRGADEPEKPAPPEKLD
ncbi:MAG TPA: hypothetical protein RMH99_24625 [Sandaracinaceae bacterium LLY-WYZ-13_1]|nr:hypothetical protein [Sandaracinaceae bacterium LLY-WYZ-13_1]